MDCGCVLCHTVKGKTEVDEVCSCQGVVLSIYCIFALYTQRTGEDIQNILYSSSSSPSSFSFPYPNLQYKRFHVKGKTEEVDDV